MCLAEKLKTISSNEETKNIIELAEMNSELLINEYSRIIEEVQ